MKFPRTLIQLGDGRWLARSSATHLAPVEVTAPSRDEALENLRGELRYRVELYPCRGVPDDYLPLEVRGEERWPGRSSRGWKPETTERKPCGGVPMNDETRKLLKIFGLAVTARPRRG